MLCPGCDNEIMPQAIIERNKYPVKGENIEIDERLYRCPECGAEWSQEDFDFAAEAYRIYRARHHMIQPEEVKTFRKSLGLTQEELANLMGWSEATVNRYEKGALQDRSHDNALRMAMTCDGLRSLLEVGGEKLPVKKRKRLLDGCRPTEFIDLTDVVRVEQTEFTGFCYFSTAKFKAVVGVLTSGTCGVWKTTLNKLLWYADFLHFKKYGVGITGLTYVRLPYGPVPDYYKFLVAFLPENEFAVEPIDFHDGGGGERISAVNAPDYSLLTASEQKVLVAVRDKFVKLTASAISELSHKETAWKETSPYERISYRFAEELKLPI